MKNRYVIILIFLFFIFDTLIINGCFVLLPFIQVAAKSRSLHVFEYSFFITLNLTWIFSILLIGLYKLNSIKTIKGIVIKSTYVIAIQLLVFFVYLYLFNPSYIKNGLVKLLIIELAALFSIRLFIYIIHKYYLKPTVYQTKIAIWGSSETAYKLGDYFSKNKLSFNFAGYFDDRQAVSDNKIKDRKLGTLKNSIQFAIENHIDELYSTIFPEDNRALTELLELADQHCVRVKFIAAPATHQQKKKNFAHLNYKLSDFYNGIPVLAKRNEPLSLLSNQILKRLFDIVFSLGVIIFVLSWLLPIVAILIKMESRGPVIFTQLRSGINNKPFWCYKFRSMAVNDKSHKMQATKNDPRVTKFGAILRKTSLDELPQFFNVLIGNMSVVGPRPHMINHTEKYRLIVDKYMVRHFLKPGITGWAQVNGHRGETQNHQQMANRVAHDVWYLENWSVLLDNKIVIQTVLNAISGEENAY